MKSNPNKVNQYTEADPRQQLFLSYYLDIKSETFSNAYQSALKAGYEDEYAKTILNQDTDWLSESLSDNKRLRKAEKKLDEILDLPAVTEDGKVDNALLGTQVKVASIYAKGLGKHKYSERIEQTGKDGGAIEVQQITGMKIVKE